ncbi:MAG: 4Fe-4S binding protein [Actinobacteria bacterium]|nr:4Fe-4S binding protein [Actinomycetota bacterium]
MKLTLGAVVLPGTSRANKTSQWRSMIPVVNQGLCNGCGLCGYFCPEGIIRIESSTCLIDYDYCKGCAICANECPKKAIEMRDEQR